MATSAAIFTATVNEPTGSLLAFPAEGPILADWVAGENGELLVAAQKIAEGLSTEYSLCVWGDTGVGKSDLLRATLHHAKQHGKSAYFIAGRKEAVFPPPLSGLLIIDDVDCLSPSAQEELLDWYDRGLRTGASGLLTSASSSPADCPLQATLRTRLLGGLAFRITPLSDEDKQQALINWATRQGFALSEDIATLLLSRLPRNMHDLTVALKKLDAFFLEQQKTLTLRRVTLWLNSSPFAMTETL